MKACIPLNPEKYLACVAYKCKSLECCLFPIHFVLGESVNAKVYHQQSSFKKGPTLLSPNPQCFLKTTQNYSFFKQKPLNHVKINANKLKKKIVKSQ